MTLAIALSALPAFTRDFTYDGIIYTVLNEDARTCETKQGDWSVRGNDVTGDIVLPEHPMYGDTEYMLIRIGDCGFRGCKNLVSIVIPEVVTSIGSHAFSL